MQIIEDRLLDRPAQWCWRDQWLTGHDSSFALLMKFAYLNALTARELAECFLNRTSRNRTAILRDVNVDLRSGQYFDYRELAEALRTNERTVAASFLFTQFPNVDDSVGELKWCEQCMAWGLHLSICQIGIVNECPIHRWPLRRCCPRCKATIPYVLTRNVFENPYLCPKCEYNLAPNMHHVRANMPILRIEDRTRIDLMTRYLSTYSSIAKRSVRIPMGVGSTSDVAVPRIEAQEIAKYVAFMGEVTSEVASDGTQACLRLASVTRIQCGCGRPTDAERLFERFLSTRHEEHFGTDAELQVAIGVYRAAKRLLERAYVGGHCRCVRMACRHLWWNMRGAKTPSICLHAATFIRWRMLWEGCGTPRYLDADQKKHYFGILGWLQSRPAPYPDDWSNERKAWMLAHVFHSVCMASFDRIQAIVEQDGEAGTLHWTEETSPAFAITHWALVKGDTPAAVPTLYTPARSEPLRHRVPQQVAKNHLRWHGSRLAGIVR
jgi:hypothetical protein